MVKLQIFLANSIFTPIFKILVRTLLYGSFLIVVIIINFVIKMGFPGVNLLFLIRLFVLNFTNKIIVIY